MNTPAAGSPAEAPLDEKVQARLLDWRRRLIDLSFRNRLVNYRPTRSSTLEIESPGFADLLADPASAQPFPFYFPPSDDHPETDGLVGSPRAHELVTQIEDRKKLEKVLENLARRSNGEFQDKGIRILHLAVGFLNWTDPVRREDLRSPLILVPVELRRESARHPYNLYFAEDDEIVINPALTIKLENDAGLQIPEDWGWEDKPVGEELNEIRTAVAETPWTVDETVVLSLFSFQKLVMYRDLLANEAQIGSHGLIEALAHGRIDRPAHDSFAAVPAESELDDAQDPRQTFSILDADASQRRCIEAAKRGCSFVMNGPPGTGKSQTIANIIAEGLADGKQILFISEKIAALDVVHKRREQKGIAEFCLKLHGRDAGRREVVESLYESLTSKTKPHSLMPERELVKLAELRQKLNQLVGELHTSNPLLLGRTPREVFARIAELEDGDPVIGGPKATASKNRDLESELSRVVEVFRLASEHWAIALDEGFAWRDFVSTNFGPEDRTELSEAIEAVVRTSVGLTDVGNSLTSKIGVAQPQTERDAEQLLKLARHLSDIPGVETRWVTADGLAAAEKAAAESRKAWERFASAEAVFRVRYPNRSATDFDSGISDRLQVALRSLDGSIGRVSAWEETLVPWLDQLSSFVGGSRELISRVLGRANDAGSALGQSTSKLNLAGLERIAGLAELAFQATKRPDRRWLIPAGATSAEAAFDALAPVIEQYHVAREVVHADYRETIFDLDLEALEARFVASEGKRLAKLGSTYRADVRALKDARVDGKAPDAPLTDVRRAREALSNGARLDQLLQEHDAALGAWQKGRDTDLAGAREALDVARQAAALLQPDSDLDRLANELCLGSTASPAIAQAAATIRELLVPLREGLELLDSLSGAPRAVSREDTELEALREELDRLGEPLAALKQAVDELRDGRIEPPGLLSEVLEDAAAISAMARAQKEIDEGRQDWVRALGDSYRAFETDWNALAGALEWTRQLLQLVAAEVPEPLLGIIKQRRSGLDAEELKVAVESYRGAYGALIGRFAPRRQKDLIASASAAPLEVFLAIADELFASMDRLGEWTDFYRAKEQAKELGWARFLNNLMTAEVPAERVVTEAERAYWTARLDLYFEEHPEIGDFRGRTHEKLIKRFADLDQATLRASTDRIIQACNAMRPAPVAMQGSEVGLLQREAKKKKRHLPVRKLLRELPNTLPRLKPCLMMSPLTVSHYLSPDHHFDLVVFDEASQVPPWDAVNCIYRGDQLVVAGDSKQLPPTPFFQLTEPDDAEVEDDETEEVMESILDSCSTVLPGESLRWHYRSRHEDLIAFSNHHFYNNGLVTFPSPTLETPELGVHYFHVPDGVYDRARSRSNRVEAKRVADRVWQHLRDRPDRTLGVVTFSVAQRDAIDDELNLLRQRHPDLEEHFTEDRLDGVFVKNLESVQGDERDVILFSMGYGKDEHGKFHMGFGPLNRDGGHRRLNVAVTRAREQVDVFASVRAGDFNLSETAAPGARFLQSYIEFAERGPEALKAEIESFGGEFESPFEEEVARAISDLGYQAIPQVGVSGFRIDLGVIDPRQPGRFVLGVEADGATYHSTPTARDRDRLRQQVLENLGWRIHRIWSWDWVREKPRELERLNDVIKAAIKAASSCDPPTAADSADEADSIIEREKEEVHVNDLRGPQDAVELPWVVPYEAANVEGFSTHLEMHEPAARPALMKTLDAVVKTEAPVHVDYAIKRIAESQGVVRRGPRVVAACRGAIKLARERGLIEVRGDFLWLPEQRLTQVRAPVGKQGRRVIQEIPPEELELAIVHLFRSSGVYDLNALVRQVARIFGFERAGASIQAELHSRIDAMISRTDP
jgi:very-short-patch-repair endonuclease